MDELASIGAPRDATSIKQEIVAGIQTHYPDWQPIEGELDNLVSQAISRLGAQLFDQQGEMSTAALRGLGQKIIAIPPIFAAPAIVASTWTLSDDDGHTIPAGTQVSIAATAELAVGFRVVEDVVVDPGASATAAGEVILRAIEPGAIGNGLSADAELSDSLSFVDLIELVGVSANGVDEEEETAYLVRLVKKLRTLSLSLIVPRDFEIDALDTPGVARALCIRGYDADAETKDVPLCQTIVPVDLDGAPLSAPGKAALLERQEAKLISGVNHFVADPTYTEIDVAISFTVLAGNDPGDVEAAVSARLQEYLSPANAGLPTGFGDAGNIGGWVNLTAVYRNELIAVVDLVPGVDRVVTLEHVKGGGAMKTQESVALTGIAPLTEPGDIEASAI
ncbi:MAG TPA: baseplate J/gp47 family protein [Solirubrobacterales bacterium]|nr:baseplate J/gp47 family protein [Solirubrobacterales bacterium]